MRGTLVGVAIATYLATAGTAVADGLYEDEGSLKDAPAPLPPIAIWAGLYIGGSVGFGVGDASGQIDIDDPEPLPSELDFIESFLSSDYDVDGAVYGAHLGYNCQDGNLVVGAEAAINGTDIDGSERCGAGFIPGCERDLDLNYYATLVGRLGYAVDNFLFYGFGGLAWGDVVTTFDLSAVPEEVEPVLLFNDSTSHLGWTAGAGIEFAFNERFSAGVEYAHVDLGDEDITGDFGALDAPEGVTFRDEVDLQFDVIKIRASIKLGDVFHREPLEPYK